MSSNEYIWTLDATNLGASTETINRFKKVNANTDLTVSNFTADKYDISAYSDIIYLDLNDILTLDNSFTLSFNIKESGSSVNTTLPVNYMTLGYHMRGTYGVTITVGRPVGSNKVVIGTITAEGVEKSNILPDNTSIDTNVEYTYTLIYNILSNSNDRITLYRKIYNSVETPLLICNSQGLTNPYISLVNRKLFFGSSMWVNEPEWSNTFDYVNMIVFGEVKLLSNEARDPSFGESHPDYPTNILVTNTNTTSPNQEFVTSSDTIHISFVSTKVSPRTIILIGIEASSMIEIGDLNFDSGTNTYTKSIAVSEFTSVIQDQIFKFAIDFSGTVTSQISTPLFVATSQPTITYDVVSVYPTSVTFGLTSIEYNYFTNQNIPLSQLSVSFVAVNTTDPADTQERVFTDVNVNSTYTIDSLTIDKIYDVYAVVKHIESLTDLFVSAQTIPTVNPTNATINLIAPVDNIIPLIDDPTRFTYTSTIGVSNISFMNVFVKDEHSQFDVYIGIFKSPNTVAIADMIDANNTGAVISYLNNSSTNAFVDVTGGGSIFTHAMIYMDGVWNKSVLEFETSYYVHLYVKDDSVSVNDYLKYNYAIINTSKEFEPFEIPQESIVNDSTSQNAATVSVFQTKDPNDTTSPADATLVGYDSTGNNNHLYVYTPAGSTTTAEEILVEGIVNTQGINTSLVSFVEVGKIDLSQSFTYSLYLKNISSWTGIQINLLQYTDANFLDATYESIKQNLITMSENSITIQQTDKSNSAVTSMSHSFTIDQTLESFEWYNVIVTYNMQSFKVFVNTIECTPAVGNTGSPYAISGKLFSPGDSSQLIHIDDVRLYNVDLKIDTINQIVSNSTKLIQLSFNDSRYVFEYDVTMFEDVFYFNVDLTEIVLNKGSSYTFYQTNDNNTAPLIIDDSSLDALIQIVYYRNNVVVTKSEYETAYVASEPHDRKIIITVGSITANSDIPYFISSTGTDTATMNVKNKEIQFVNSANNLANAMHSGTESKITVGKDSPVGSGSVIFDSANQDVLTVPSQTVTPNNMSISTWFKPSDVSVSNPIISQTGSFKFGLNSEGKMELNIV